MRDKRDDIKPRSRIILAQDARFVYKYAQCSFLHHQPPYNKSDGRTRHLRRRNSLASRRSTSHEEITDIMAYFSSKRNSPPRSFSQPATGRVSDEPTGERQELQTGDRQHAQEQIQQKQNINLSRPQWDLSDGYGERTFCKMLSRTWAIGAGENILQNVLRGRMATGEYDVSRWALSGGG